MAPPTPAPRGGAACSAAERARDLEVSAAAGELGALSSFFLSLRRARREGPEGVARAPPTRQSRPDGAGRRDGGCRQLRPDSTALRASGSHASRNTRVTTPNPAQRGERSASFAATRRAALMVVVAGWTTWRARARPAPRTPPNAVLALGHTDLRVTVLSLRATCTRATSSLRSSRSASSSATGGGRQRPGRHTCARTPMRTTPPSTTPRRARCTLLPRPLTRPIASSPLGRATSLACVGRAPLRGPRASSAAMAGFAHRWPTRCSFPNRASVAYTETQSLLPAPHARIGLQGQRTWREVLAKGRAVPFRRRARARPGGLRRCRSSFFLFFLATHR